MYVSRVCALRYARVFLFNIRPSERFNVSDGFEVLIKKINLSWIRRVRVLGHTPYTQATLACGGVYNLKIYWHGLFFLCSFVILTLILFCIFECIFEPFTKVVYTPSIFPARRCIRMHVKHFRIA